jgi:hypothetical protein
VVTTVSALLDVLEEQGVLSPMESPTVSMTPVDTPVGLRQNVIRELLNSEREYVAALEKLMVHHNFKVFLLTSRNSETNYKQRIY